MKHFTQEQIDHMNQKWLNQKKDALPDSVKIDLVNFSERVWKGTPSKNRASVLKLEKSIAIRKVESLVMSIEGAISSQQNKVQTSGSIMD